MKLNEEQWIVKIDMESLIEQIKRQFPKGYRCFTHCNGCPYDCADANSIEYKLCELLETLEGT